MTYHSIEPQKTPLGKNPYPLKMLDAHAVALDQIAIKKSREYGFMWSRQKCIREAIAQYVEREMAK